MQHAAAAMAARDEVEDLRKRVAAAEADLDARMAAARALREETIRPLEVPFEINKDAENWLKRWKEEYERFLAEQSGNPFALMEIDLRFKLAEAETYSAGREVIDQIHEYYNAERKKINDGINEREAAMQRALSKSRIDDIQYEMDEAVKAIKKLEEERVFAAAGSEEEIAGIRALYADMETETRLQFKIEIDKTKLDEAREAVEDWQNKMEDSLLRVFMKIPSLADEAAVVLSRLSAQLLELSANAALSGFQEFGRALGLGKDAAESLQAALTAMARQILNQLPMMFLQAGLQLISQGQWPLGLGFVAAAGSSALIAGYVEGKQEAAKNAHGNAFDSNGIVPFAQGGTFSNQIVTAPAYFRFGGSLGVMGEAGPEAILPLKRMPGGNLGVETSGGGSQVLVKIYNYSGEKVQQKESTDGNGNKEIGVVIGQMIDNHISSGKADRSMGRFGLRATGV